VDERLRKLRHLADRAADEFVEPVQRHRRLVEVGPWGALQ
jgi:hypothetical protein